MTPLLIALAWAEQPFPAYDDVEILKTWDKIDGLIEAACQGAVGAGRRCVDGPLDEAIERGASYQKYVIEDARLSYLMGLAYLSKGDRDLARTQFQRSVKADNDRADAWHDLGEIALQDGDFDTAEKAFQRVSELIDRGRQSWLGPWRLAEVAAHRRQPEVFEANMRIALERGFSFRYVFGLPNWKGFLADDVMGPSVRKLITVYGTPEVLSSLEP